MTERKMKFQLKGFFPFSSIPIPACLVCAVADDVCVCVSANAKRKQEKAFFRSTTFKTFPVVFTNSLTSRAVSRAALFFDG